MMYFILTKKHCYSIAVLLSLSILFVFAGISHAGLSEKGKPLKILIDAGHGLPDGGAVGTLGTIEQEINLAIAKKLEETLTAKNIEVAMTRSDENGLWSKKSTTIREKKLEDMKKRLSIMKKSDADLFISIHINSYTDESASGLRIFYAQRFPEIKPLSENIQSRMSDITGARASVIKTADNRLFLMKNPPMPAILVECGFLSNPLEEKKLSDEEYQARLAWAIADAVEKYYAMP